MTWAQHSWYVCHRVLERYYSTERIGKDTSSGQRTVTQENEQVQKTQPTYKVGRATQDNSHPQAPTRYSTMTNPTAAYVRHAAE